MNNSIESGSDSANMPTDSITRRHLRGLLEALLFMSDRPLKVSELAEIARAETKEVRALLEELSLEYREQGRGFLLDEFAAGFQFHTSPTYAPFVRDLTAQKPVKLTRAQIETLAIIAYRQPITRPEIEDIRGVDAGAVVKILLERDMVRILGKKDEPGRPLLYGTTSHFLEFFGLKSLRELPTLREFTELTDESRELVARELGEVLPEGPREHASLSNSINDSKEKPLSSTDALEPTSIIESSLESNLDSIVLDIQEITVANDTIQQAENQSEHENSETHSHSSTEN